MDYIEAIQFIQKENKEAEAIAVLSRSLLTKINLNKIENSDFFNRLLAINEYNSSHFQDKQIDFLSKVAVNNVVEVEL
ncbi:MAG: hypothetical protein IJS58_00110 [Bacilli bacterium]|nr:hypothetical protein [Bacilli bacterium]